MTFKRWDGAAFVDITTLKRWDGAAWVDVSELKRWDGAAWVHVWPDGGGGDLSATHTPGTVFAIHVEDGPPFTTVDSTIDGTPGYMTIVPSGGTGPYTYAYSYVSGSTAIMDIAMMSDDQVGFYANVGKGKHVTAVWQCVVTDSLLATATVTFNVNLRYESGA